MLSVEEQEMVEQIKLKNERGLSQLLDEYGGLLKAIIQKYLQGNRRDAEECMADVLVAIWYNIDSFDPKKNEFRNWIAAVAKYKAIDYVRKSTREKQYVSGFQYEEDMPTSHDSYHDRVDLQSLLDELPAVERAIFEKYYLHGVPSKEIASELQERETWVHNKLSRGRRKLRSILLRSEG
ncbi:sigma-70 family RNA polymerase sigma factor [Bacillus sp. B-jedd]|uniref:sigma-70 family RNA polymerase sigma factor n=1 Tax=Bacillus sp. B-jedd TaxID=1476857 RepID=UPI0005156628|nr:sigma-70 family RNA polymerase sigma factor [Bacillus sp. B-jedd]CEG28808.1 ECF subfamily RNA polymerase sigma-24 subunit [Bacillus sp. B-jedd]